MTTEQFSQVLQGKAITGILIAGGAAIIVMIGKIFLEKAIFAAVRFIKHGPKKAGKTLSAGEEIAVLDAKPTCPTCGGEMMKRTAKKGRNEGSRFWGCRSFPSCRGARAL